MMGSRVKPTRVQCINCNICVNKLRRYPALELDTRVTFVLSNWVYPRIITEDDYVCEACRDLAIVKVNNNVKQEVADDDCQQDRAINRGHSNVCLLCGRSTMQRRSNKILRDNLSELQQAIVNILQNQIAPQQITVSDHVCHACWVRLRREASRRNQIATSLLNVKDEAPEEHQPLPSPTVDPTPVTIESNTSKKSPG